MGTVLGALGSAASTGADAYKLGKLDAALSCDAGDCRHAAVRAAGDLGLRVSADSIETKPNVIYTMTLTDDLNHTVEIRVQHRTRSMCLCRVDVGLFGSEPVARLVMEHVRKHLPKSAATNP
jgi:hypothetical protein